VSIAALVAGCTPASDEVLRGSFPIWNGTTDTADRINDATVVLYAPGDGSGPTRVCTGTLITPTVVLTASHCVFNSQASSRTNKIRVGLDATVPRSAAVPNGYLEYDVVGCLRHPTAYPGGVPAGSGANCYVGTGNGVLGLEISADADVALLWLATPVPRDVARPRPLNLTSPVTVGATVTMSGYGRTGANRDDGSLSNTRQTGITTVNSLGDVANAPGGPFTFNNVLTTQAPTGGPAGRKGDSGGPLLAPGSASPSLQSQVSGVASYVYFAGSTRTVYTALSGVQVGPWLSLALLRHVEFGASGACCACGSKL
jgi:Trypsin